MSGQVVWKYPLEAKGSQALILPSGAKVLTVQMQGETLCLWALVTPGMAVEQRTFRIYGTGHPGVHGDYIGTFQMDAGALVFHVFEEHSTPL